MASLGTDAPGVAPRPPAPSSLGAVAAKPPRVPGSNLPRIQKEPVAGRTIVWARMRGFPAWPALVVKFPEQLTELARRDRPLHVAKSVPVFFLGSYEYGWVPPDQIYEFEANMQRFSVTKMRPDKRFAPAIKEAEEGTEMALSKLRATLEENARQVQFASSSEEEEFDDESGDEKEAEAATGSEGDGDGKGKRKRLIQRKEPPTPPTATTGKRRRSSNGTPGVSIVDPGTVPVAQKNRAQAMADLKRSKVGAGVAKRSRASVGSPMQMPLSPAGEGDLLAQSANQAPAEPKPELQRYGLNTANLQRRSADPRERALYLRHRLQRFFLGKRDHVTEQLNTITEWSKIIELLDDAAIDAGFTPQVLHETKLIKAMRMVSALPAEHFDTAAQRERDAIGQDPATESVDDRLAMWHTVHSKVKELTERWWSEASMPSQADLSMQATASLSSKSAPGSPTTESKLLPTENATSVHCTPNSSINIAEPPALAVHETKQEPELSPAIQELSTMSVEEPILTPELVDDAIKLVEPAESEEPMDVDS